MRRARESGNLGRECAGDRKPATVNEFRYIAPFGEVDLQRESHAAIERHLRIAWESAF